MRIALATVGSTGDIAPFVLLARTLAARGHEITVVSWPVHAPRFDALSGVRFVAAGPHRQLAPITETAAAAARERNPLAQVAILRDFHLVDAVAHYRELRSALADHQLVVLHGIHSLGQAAAHDLALPWASAVFDPVLQPTASAPPAGMPSLGPLNPLGWWLLNRALDGLQRPLTDALAAVGSTARVRMFRARSPRLHLIGASPAIVRVASDLPPTTHVTGAWLDDSAPAPLPTSIATFLGAGGSPILVTFGSMAGADPAALRAALESLNASGVRAIVQRGIHDRSLSAEILEIDAIDHRALMPLCALVVHHAGSGTTHTSVAAGTPSVTVPHVGDQGYWAERLHALGVAPPPIPLHRLNERRLEQRIRTALDDPRYRAAATSLGQRLRGETGVTTAARLIEGVL